MGLLAAANYDPSTAVSKATSVAGDRVAMTALDTTNLRVTFTAPANGSVLVRLKGQAHGGTTAPRVLLGVLDGSTVIGRMRGHGGPPFGSGGANTIYAQEAAFVVTGLSGSKTWDAAYGLEVIASSSGFKYGGPNNTTGADAWGAFQFEVWETANLLAGTLYDPSTAVTKSATALLAMTALDTTNLRHTFTAPASGNVFWRIATLAHGDTTQSQAYMLGIMDGSTVVQRSAPLMSTPATAVATASIAMEASGVVTGLSGSKTWDAAYGVETVAAAGGIKYGGPNNTTSDDAWGGIAFEVWAA